MIQLGFGCLFLLSLVDAIDITLAPTVVIVFEGDVAAFSCRADFTLDKFQWVINRTSTNQIDLETIINTDLSLRKSTLQFIARLEFHQSIINCIAFVGADVITSNDATLEVQGLLGPVRYLAYEFDGKILVVSWVSPFSIDVPGSTSTQGYCVNVTSSTLPTDPILSYCREQPQILFFEFNIPFSLRCTPFNITVEAVNRVGSGDTASLLYDACADKIKSCPTLATCEGIRAPGNGYISSYTTEENAVVTYYCKPGYYLSPPVSFSTCNSSGLWIPEPAFIKCIPIPTCKLAHPTTNETIESQQVNFSFSVRPTASKAAMEILTKTEKAVIVVVGFLFFIIGVAASSILLLVLLKVYLRIKCIKSRSKKTGGIAAGETGSSKHSTSKDKRGKVKCRTAGEHYSSTNEKYHYTINGSSGHNVESSTANRENNEHTEYHGEAEAGDSEEGHQNTRLRSSALSHLRVHKKRAKKTNC